MARNICTVIDSMIALVLEAESEQSFKDQFKNRLLKIKEDSAYHPPEEQQECWAKIVFALKILIPRPTQEWHYQLLSLFSEQPIESIKAYWADRAAKTTTPQ